MERRVEGSTQLALLAHRPNGTNARGDIDIAARVSDEGLMKRFVTVILSLLLFSPLGCDEEENETTPGGGSDSASGDGDSSAGAGSVDSGNGEGGAGSGDGGASSGDADPPPEEEDAFCSHAKSGFAALDDYTTVMNELSLTGEEVPASRINENGALALGFAADFGDEMADAAAFVVDDEVAAAFDDLLIYHADYMVPQAELAASATSDMQYGMASLELLQEDGVAQAVADGTLASGTARQYAIERCGPLD